MKQKIFHYIIKICIILAIISQLRLPLYLYHYLIPQSEQIVRHFPEFAFTLFNTLTIILSLFSFKVSAKTRKIIILILTILLIINAIYLINRNNFQYILLTLISIIYLVDLASRSEKEKIVCLIVIFWNLIYWLNYIINEWYAIGWDLPYLRFIYHFSYLIIFILALKQLTGISIYEFFHIIKKHFSLTLLYGLFFLIIGWIIILLNSTSEFRIIISIIIIYLSLSYYKYKWINKRLAIFINYIGVFLLLIVGYAFLIEPHQIRIVEKTFYLSNLSKSFDGLRILHLTDLHINSWGKDEKKIIKRVKELSPDLIVLTGDYSDDAYYNLYIKRLLCTCEAPLGVWGVLGNSFYQNHYVSQNINTIKQIFKSANAHLLINQNAPLVIQQGIEQDTLWLIGLDDPWTEHSNMEMAFNGVADSACKIVLVHFVDNLENYISYHPDLILSGHTHGGQIRLPFISKYLGYTKYGLYIRGSFEHKGIQLYVNSGLGCSFLPLRFGVKPEIAIITLRTNRF